MVSLPLPPQLPRIVRREGRVIRRWNLGRRWERWSVCRDRRLDCYLQRRSHRDDRVLWRTAIANISASVFRVVSPGHSPDIHRGLPPPRVFILAHLSLGKRRVIPGEGRTFFLFFFLFFSPLRRSQVLTKNLARWTDLNETRDRLESVHPRNSNGGDGEGRIKGFPSLEGREVRKILLRLSSFNNSCRIH